LRVLIVDDGSTDDTWQEAQRLARRFKRVSAIHQANGGKSSALNNAIKRSRSEIVICVDADTVFPASTVTRLIRHFRDPKVGAVAGVVKVGNFDGPVTRWQALEYTIGIYIERSAQALMQAIMIVPGACGAWRREALMKVGGFSHITLAEDGDATLKLHKLGYKVLQDNGAIGYTEVPDSLRGLVKQRFRWTFGTIQALWLHRKMIFRRKYGWLGMLVMPSAVVTTLVPMVFWPALLFVNLQNLVAGNYLVIVLFFALSLTLQFMLAAIALWLAKEPLRFLLAVPYGRFIYGPIRTYIMYNTIVTALRGAYVGWNKLTRTGTVNVKRVPGSEALEPAVATSA
jgi:biofilm PGA synthesis N-glycosyltransferase PgaC